MKIIAALIALSCFNVMASTKSCSTVGDALDSVTITKTEVKIADLDGSEITFKVMEGLSSANEIIAAVDTESVYGGAVANALKLDIAKDGESATMAARGNVYLLNCQ